MRQNIEAAAYEQLDTVHECRRTYADLLKQLMHAMKRNYQELQTSCQSDVATVQVQGSYVDFVQRIVSSMQQYTADICHIDRFFTDSAAFPLPANDPTYVVGKLRAYVPKLSEESKRKALATFVHTVSERAAVDNQQAYLVDQFVTAVTGVPERGNSKATSLRHVLLTAVFPAYIESALATACSWIMARPIIQACGRVAGEILYSMILEDPSSTAGVISTLSSLLRSMTRPLELAITHPGQVRLPYSQVILAECFAAAERCTTCVRTLHEHTRDAHTLENDLNRYLLLADGIESNLLDEDEFDVFDIPGGEREISCPWPDTLTYTRKQVRDKSSSDWYATDGQYFVRRGAASVEVKVTTDGADEKDCLLDRLRLFRTSYRKVFGGGPLLDGRSNNMVDELIV
jgi:hypothetical protein